MRRILLLLVAPVIISALIGLLASALGVEWAGFYSLKLGVVIVLAGGAAILLRGGLQRWAENDFLDAVCVVGSVFLWTAFVAGRIYFGNHSVPDDVGGFRPIGMDEAVIQMLVAGIFAGVATAVAVSISLVLLRRFFRN